MSNRNSFGEMGVRYGIEPDVSDADRQQRLEEVREQLRREIRREMKIKEGAEKMREATKDKKSLNSIVKQANNKLQDLQQELHEVSSYMLLANAAFSPDTSSGWYLGCSITAWGQLLHAAGKRCLLPRHVFRLVPRLFHHSMRSAPTCCWQTLPSPQTRLQVGTSVVPSQHEVSSYMLLANTAFSPDTSSGWYLGSVPGCIPAWGQLLHAAGKRCLLPRHVFRLVPRLFHPRLYHSMSAPTCCWPMLPSPQTRLQVGTSVVPSQHEVSSYMLLANAAFSPDTSSGWYLGCSITAWGQLLHAAGKCCLLHRHFFRLVPWLFHPRLYHITSYIPSYSPWVYDVIRRFHILC